MSDRSHLVIVKRMRLLHSPYTHTAAVIAVYLIASCRMMSFNSLQKITTVGTMSTMHHSKYAATGRVTQNDKISTAAGLKLMT